MVRKSAIITFMILFDKKELLFQFLILLYLKEITSFKTIGKQKKSNIKNSFNEPFNAQLQKK